MLLLKKRTVLARGEQTVLRRFGRRDVERWVSWPRHADPLFESYNPPSLTLDECAEYYARRHSDRSTMQFAVDDYEGDLVGRISLRDIDWRHRHSVLGLTFHPQRLGRGLGTDALQVLMGYYFGSLGMDRLWLDVAAHNSRAYRCYTRCGFQVCGHHWGEGQPGLDSILSSPEHSDLRRLFRLRDGHYSPLLIDMVLTRATFRAQIGQVPAPRSRRFSVIR